LTTSQKKTLIEKLLKVAPAPDLLDWAKRFLPDRITHAYSVLHGVIGSVVTGLEEGNRVNIVGPRDSAKSTLGSLAFPLCEALEGRETYIILVGDTGESAKGILERFAWEIENNELLQREYPDSCKPKPGGVWNKTNIVLANGCHIEAISTRQSMRGRLKQTRPSLIVVDDPQDDKCRTSNAKREESWEWFIRALIPLGNEKTRILTLGTSIHRSGIVDKLDGRPGWKTIRVKAIIDWPDRMDLWHTWQDILFDTLNEPEENEAEAKRFYDRNESEMIKGSKVNWPERKDLYTLMQLLATMGKAAFEAEYQARPTNPDLCEFEDSWLEPNVIFVRDLPRDGVRVISVDPSMGRNDTSGDYSAINLITYHDNCFWVYPDIKRRNATQLVSDIVEYCDDFKPVALGIENNGFQSVLEDVIINHMEEEGSFPIVPIGITNTANKIQRIKRLSPYLRRKMIKIVVNSCGSEILHSQLVDFPIGDHDDGPDSLEMGLRLLQGDSAHITETIAGAIQ
jgi:predicted phage terminase large subunit-like protein